MLGVDTGGTYTDAVVYDEATGRVLASAKALTTPDDLAVGLANAIDRVMDDSGVNPEALELVSISTTLATNALVEGKGRPAAIVVIGFDEPALDRAGLRTALGDDHAVFVDGGHTSHGEEIFPLDLDGLSQRIAQLPATVEAYAVTSQFSVRNASHELAARERIAEITGRPVTCSHRLSARLNGPKRALTALLNARLVAITDALVTTTEQLLRARSIDAPLMVVRGDGSLVSADFVRERPVETILSGPAASVIGATHLTKATSGIVADMGGTTTDIAILVDGTPDIAPDGAVIGGHRTMISAVAVHTHGLGGDSQVDVAGDGDPPEAALRIGPRRVIPLSLLAMEQRAIVHELLDRQLDSETPSDLDALVVLAGESPVDGLGKQERALVAEVARQPRPARDLVTSSVTRTVIDRLLRRGLIRMAGFTPTDACHVVGRQASYDAGAARKGAELVARRRDRFGDPIAASGPALADLTVAEVGRRATELVLETALDRDGFGASGPLSPLVRAALDGHEATARLTAGVAVPLVALGAPAATYYPAVSDALGTDVIIPEHSAVANAIGAVVGRIRVERSVTIGAPDRNKYVVHLGEHQHLTMSLADARSIATSHLEAELAQDMRAAGADGFETTATWDEHSAAVAGETIFVEGTLRMVGTARPRLGRVSRGDTSTQLA